MKRFKSFLMVIGILAASFAGGAVSHWILSGTSQAQAAGKTRSNEDAMRWSFAKPVITRKLTVGDPKAKTSGILDGSGMKLYDSRGKVRIRMDSSTGKMALLDGSGRDRVRFGIMRGGQTGIALLDTSGRPRIQINDRGLKLFNSSGREVGNFGFQSDGTMGVSVAGRGGKLRRIDKEKKSTPKSP